MEMGDQYGLADLRQLIAGRTRFSATLQPAEVEQFNGHQPNLTAGQHFEMLMLGRPRQLSSGGGGGGGDHHQVVLPRGVMEFCSADSTTPPPNSTSTTTTNITTNATATNTNTTTTASAGGGGGGGGGGVCGMEMMEGCCNNNNMNNGGGGGGGGGDGGNSRWPRQETLTLLEIRSRLDHKFKEANQKGPLWDEVSRIMAEEHGYQRSGKKCREKFENLYKYYKKTKEGKAGRQDGKNYRFFRQLEALYGETTTINNNPVSLLSETHFDNNGNNFLQFQTTNNASTHSNQEVLMQAHHQKLSAESLISLSNSSEFDNSSEDEEEEENVVDEDLTTIAFIGNHDSLLVEKKNKKLKDNNSLKRGRKNWKAKIRDFVDLRMKKLMEKQEAWLDKMLKTLENKEQERIIREEEWRKQETARLDREHKFWAKERAWFEARDAALMEALQRFIGTELKVTSPDQEVMATDLHENSENQNENGTQTLERSTVNSTHRWPEAEISNLIHLRTGMESRFQQSGCSEGALWEEISAKMACLGYDQSAKSCEEKWVNINKIIRRTNECNKKRKENYSRSTCPYFQHFDSIYSHEGGGAFAGHGMDDQEGPETMGIQLNDGPSPSNSNAGPTVQDNCFRFMMSTSDQGDNLWENFGVKLNKGGS